MKAIKTMKALSLAVCRREGKKESISKAQVDEVLGIVSELLYDDEFDDGAAGGFRIFGALYENGRKRVSKKLVKRKKHGR